MNDVNPADAPQSRKEFLRCHPPFSELPEDELGWLAAHTDTARFPSDAVILRPGSDDKLALYIVQTGQVQLEDVLTEQGRPIEFFPGMCFPLAALMARRGVASLCRTVTETTCLTLGVAEFHEFLGLSQAFRTYCAGQVSAMLDASISILRTRQAATGLDTAYRTPLKALIKRAPVAVVQQTPIREALQLMRDQNVGSVVALDDDARVCGIVSMRDVLNKVALGGQDIAAPVAHIMSPNVVTLPSDALAYEAAMAMAQVGARHLPVVEDGRLIGVISESSLVSSHELGVRQMYGAIKQATTVEALAKTCLATRQAIGGMVKRGAGADYLMRYLTTLTDLATQRLIELQLAQRPLAGGSLCWIALGSEGRSEQTFFTDQDNAIIFRCDPGVEVGDFRASLVAFAREVNQGLDACGFPLCRGEIMAGNAKWCLSLPEWRTTFSHWINHGDPEALLNSTIFFDFRPIYGDFALAGELRGWLANYALENNRFLTQMAQSALDNQPPLGLIRDFVLASGGDHPHTLDLKVNGFTPFVDAARIFSLATGVTHPNTQERLRLSAERMAIAMSEGEAWLEALLFIQLLRLKLQESQLSVSSPPHNHLDPDNLNELDRRVLKEALRQARKVQMRLARQYSLIGSGGFGA